ncbi:ATP-binding protein [Altererythrobacter sp. ZODW24]|uniref:sensor histidine kinase n=1 Tax=Altererythrobacter sp. ZODW24 TaxID=2185142 RepID=UPI001F08251D|nr:ATP-binding protein [Altererythrobacter sp. ZODW24]
MLTLIGAAVMLIAGAHPGLILGIMIVWIGSLWLSQPVPVAKVERKDGVKLTRETMSGLIEPFSLPLLVLDQDRIISANLAAREALGNHIIGQDARVAFRHPAAIALIDDETAEPTIISGLTGPRTLWRMARVPIDNRYTMIELSDHRAEADISRAHTDFVANASHELRTPLASIIGYVETLSEEGADADAVMTNKFHGIVLQEARRLQSLVSDLMSLSRVEAEKHDAPSEVLELAPLLRQASADGAGVDRTKRLNLESISDNIVVLGDRRQLEQLVRNLVDNALKYSTANSQVDVTLQTNSVKEAVFRVTDRGEGIDAEHIPHLTRRFYRTDPGRSRAAGGTGLGLAIVKHIVERHRGHLDIESEKGQGTTVSVRIPLQTES